jgi:general stress protein 26
MGATFSPELKKYMTPKMTAYLATVNADANFLPEVRPVSLMEHEGRFYIATGASSRKAKEMQRHPFASALVHFRDNQYSGYLRIVGRVEVVLTPEKRAVIAGATGYPVVHFWKTYDNPEIFFAEIKPLRVEFMKPGDDDAVEVL